MVVYAGFYSITFSVYLTSYFSGCLASVFTCYLASTFSGYLIKAPIGFGDLAYTAVGPASELVYTIAYI
jgi:hypothetical protein